MNKLPTITFATIYDFLVSRKVFLKRVRDIEIIVDDQDENLLNDKGSSDDSWYESVEYTRALNKLYRFLRMVVFRMLSIIPGLTKQILSAFQLRFYHL